MSYYFTMSFATVPDRASAFSLCQQAVNRLCEKPAAREHIRNTYPFFLQRCSFEHVEPTNFLREMWIQDIFQLRFVYWEQYNLLSLCGDDYPCVVTDLFGPHIGFQNSTDQDYELSTWDANIPLFQRIISETPKDGNTLFEDCDDNLPEGYAYRSSVYQKIFKTLDLDNWLYGRDEPFERIRMTGLTSMEKIHDIYRWGSIVWREN